MEEDLLAIGEIINVQGIKGRLKVASFGDSTEAFLSHLSLKEIF
jgi:ribosomal 30S subunit maturation factor RimM